MDKFHIKEFTVVSESIVDICHNFSRGNPYSPHARVTVEEIKRPAEGIVEVSGINTKSNQRVFCHLEANGPSWIAYPTNEIRDPSPCL